MTEHRHNFDPLSGWCDGHRCGVRDDMRVTTYAGDVLRPGHVMDMASDMDMSR